MAMNSGWDKLLMTPRFAGRDDAGKNHTPGFHGETAHMLISERNVKGIGVDTLSLDTGINTGAIPGPLWLARQRPLGGGMPGQSRHAAAEGCRSWCSAAPR